MARLLRLWQKVKDNIYVMGKCLKMTNYFQQTNSIMRQDARFHVSCARIESYLNLATKIMSIFLVTLWANSDWTLTEALEYIENHSVDPQFSLLKHSRTTVYLPPKHFHRWYHEVGQNNSSHKSSNKNNCKMCFTRARSTLHWEIFLNNPCFVNIRSQYWGLSFHNHLV